MGSALRGVPAPWARPASRLLQQPRGLPAAPLSLTFSSAAARGTLPAGSCRFLFGWPSIRHRVKTETLTQGPMAKPGGRPASPLSSAGPGRLCPARPAAQRAGWTALPAECALTRALFPEVSALRTPSPLKSLLKCHVPTKRPASTTIADCGPLAPLRGAGCSSPHGLAPHDVYGVHSPNDVVFAPNAATHREREQDSGFCPFDSLMPPKHLEFSIYLARSQ